MKSILLFDVSGIFRAAWHATEHAEIGEAFRRTVSFVHSNAAGFDGVGICVDMPPYKRREIAPDYKAQREQAPEALYEQQRAAISQLDKDGFRIFGAQGYEADDIIATVTAWAVEAGHEVTIYSADKDMLQLVNDRVTVISTATGAIYGPDEVKAKLGVSPEMVPDLLALAGDSADNIPGIAGCGVKTAAKWLAEHGGLGGVITNAAKLGDRFAKLVTDSKESLGVSWRLAQLMSDAPIKPEEIMQPKTAQQTAPEPVTEEAPTMTAEPEVIGAKDQQPVRTLARVEAVPPPAPAEWNKSLEPRDHGQAWGLAKMLHESRMFGDFPNPQAILAIIMTGRSHGLDAVTSLRGFHCIKGKASPSAQMMIGLVKRSPACEYFRLVRFDEKAATWETKRRGDPEPTVLTYTIEDAQIAGLLGNDQWKKRPKTMLRWRAGVELARLVYSDVVMGLYTPDELNEAQAA